MLRPKEWDKEGIERLLYASRENWETGCMLAGDLGKGCQCRSNHLLDFASSPETRRIDFRYQHISYKLDRHGESCCSHQKKISEANLEPLSSAAIRTISVVLYPVNIWKGKELVETNIKETIWN